MWQGAKTAIAHEVKDEDKAIENKDSSSWKKTIAVSAIILGLGAGLAIAPVTIAQTAAAATKVDQHWQEKLNTQIDLAQAKVAALRAQIALEIEKSPARAKQALDDSLAALAKAKDNARDAADERIDALRADVKAAQNAIANAPATASKKVDDAVDATQTRIAEYGQIVADTDEAKVLKRRYAQLQAQAALMKAQLAEKADQTGEQARSYLDKAKAWYGDAKTNASKKWQDTLSATTDRIDAAKKTVGTKGDQASEAISNLAKKAGDLVRGDKAGEAAK